ncbi:MAG: HEAT repeat domain-containing protein [Planctomycetaceae bacterium]
MRLSGRVHKPARHPLESLAMWRILSANISRRVLWVAGALAGLALLGGNHAAWADLAKLASGGELRGKIVKARTNREVVTIETLFGAEITVARTDLQFLTMRPLNVEEYESRVRKVATTVEAHWELAEWCKQKSLMKQRVTHLVKVVELDAQHEAAHRALGHVRSKGAWISKDELMASQGYVKYKGRYITPQELEMLEKTGAERKSEREWSQKVRMWAGWASGDLLTPPAKMQEGWQSLGTIDEPDAAPAVARFLGEHEQREFRLLAARILARIGGEKPIPGLVKLSLQDDDPEIRTLALDGLSADQQARAVPLFVNALHSEFNAIVSRAGAALGTIGNEKAVAPLIDALITSHEYKVRVPDGTPSYSFSVDGRPDAGFALPPGIQAGLLAGQYPNGVIVLDGSANGELSRTKLVPIRVEQQNPEVLAALQKLTGKDFGYDQRTWHLWWAAEKHNGVILPEKS